jgi:hypothetical protein
LDGSERGFGETEVGGLLLWIAFMESLLLVREKDLECLDKAGVNYDSHEEHDYHSNEERGCCVHLPPILSAAVKAKAAVPNALYLGCH